MALQITLDKHPIGSARLNLLVPVIQHRNEAPLGQYRLPVVRCQGLHGFVSGNRAPGAVLDMQRQVVAIGVDALLGEAGAAVHAAAHRHLPALPGDAHSGQQLGLLGTSPQHSVQISARQTAIKAETVEHMDKVIEQKLTRQPRQGVSVFLPVEFGERLGSGIGLFVVGWLIQFIGHYYEGKKPAFVDDIMGLIIGPLFVVAEVVFALGLRASVLQAIEARVGPVRKRDMTAGAA